MPRIYGTESKYLKTQAKRFSLAEKLALYLTTLFGTFSFLAFMHGLFVHNSVFLKWLFTTLFCLTVLIFKKAYYYISRSLNYTDGQSGEKEILTELLKLPENYSVFCDLKFKNKNYNIDFLVVGPTGLFVIEVKSHRGNFSQKYISQKFINQTLKNTLAIHKYIGNLNNQEIFINAVLVFSNSEAHVPTFRTDNYVTVVHKEGLVKYIITRNKIGTDIKIHELENHLVPLIVHNML
jgi:hypothetical protein